MESEKHLKGEVEFLQSICSKGMNVIEVGAHSGVTTAAISESIGNSGVIYTFEPVKEYFNVLRKNIETNKLSNVKIYMQALGNKCGFITFYKHGEGSGITFEKEADKIQAKLTTITDFLKSENISKNIDVLNMDCEGSELFVLQGAAHLLLSNHPDIFCEVHHGYLEILKQSVDDLIKFLEGLDYHVKPIQIEDMHSKATYKNCTHIYATVNIKR